MVLRTGLYKLRFFMRMPMRLLQLCVNGRAIFEQKDSIVKWPFDTFETIQLSCRVSVATIMLLGAIGKAVHFVDFRKIVGAYNILPTFLLAPASIAFVSCEIAVATGLILSELALLAAATGAALLLAYSAAIAINLIRGRRQIPCGCGGRGQQGISWWLVLRNFALIGILAIGIGQSGTVATILALF